MLEFWHFAKNNEAKARQFLNERPEPEMTLEYEVVQHDFINAGKASAEIKKMLKRLGVDSTILRRVAIASYETEINVAAHSYGGEVKCEIYPEQVHITFTDRGPGIDDIEKCMEPGYSTASELVQKMGFGAGLGLPNIRKNSDMLHICSEPNEYTKVEILVFFQDL